MFHEIIISGDKPTELKYIYSVNGIPLATYHPVNRSWTIDSRLPIRVQGELKRHLNIMMMIDKEVRTIPENILEAIRERNKDMGMVGSNRVGESKVGDERVGNEQVRATEESVEEIEESVEPVVEEIEEDEPVED